MARRTTRRSSRAGYASRGRASPRRSYRSRSASPSRRRTARSRSYGTRRGAQTIRIELHGVGANPVARPAVAQDGFVQPVAASPTATKPRF